ncbi:MAG: hypothetical protein AB1894_14160 [Chloroflexota bacterium]
MNEERGPWYLLTGLLIGIALGLMYAWAVQPVEYVDTSPASLRPEFKDYFRALIASAYVANGDLVRAEARLEKLEDDDILRVLVEQAQRTLAQGDSPDEARSLGILAIALGQGAPGPALAITPIQGSLTPTDNFTDTPTYAIPTTTPTATFTATSTLQATPSEAASPTLTDTPTLTPTLELEGTPSATPRPRPTFTPTRTPTVTLTPGGPFLLVSQEKICDQMLPEPLLLIEATNLLGDPLPGILVTVTWNGGEERFYTGLKPEKGLGYADFTAVQGVTYTVRLGDGGQPVTGLTAVQCQGAGGATYWGAWLLKFVQT